MSEQFWWYLARAGGITAWLLLALSVAFGLAQAGRLVTRPSARSWIADTHTFLGGMATIFTAVHIVGLVADNYVTFSWSEILVPMASEWRPGAVAFGVVAMYLLAAVELTALARKWLPRRVWRGVHQLSIPLFVVGTVHGVLAGTDVTGAIYLATAVACCVALIALLVARVSRVARPA